MLYPNMNIATQGEDILVMNEIEIYNKAIEDITKKIIGYYGHIGSTNGASVQYYVKQIKKEFIKENDHED